MLKLSLSCKKKKKVNQYLCCLFTTFNETDVIGFQLLKID